MKKCPTCGGSKSLTDFYKDKRTPDGLKSQCKTCHTEGSMRTRDKDNSRRLNMEHMKRARIANPEKYRERERIAARKRIKDERFTARMILNGHTRSGKIERPNYCQECGAECKPVAHHPDYAKPLLVEWLCTLCHGKRHRLCG